MAIPSRDIVHFIAIHHMEPICDVFQNLKGEESEIDIQIHTSILLYNFLGFYDIYTASYTLTNCFLFISILEGTFY